MTPDDEALRLKESERGRQAVAILTSPIWDEAYTALVNAEMSRLMAKGLPDDEVLAAKRRVLAINDVKHALAEIMKTGQMAEMQLKEHNNG